MALVKPLFQMEILMKGNSKMVCFQGKEKCVTRTSNLQKGHIKECLEIIGEKGMER